MKRIEELNLDELTLTRQEKWNRELKINLIYVFTLRRMRGRHRRTGWLADEEEEEEEEEEEDTAKRSE